MRSKAEAVRLRWKRLLAIPMTIAGTVVAFASPSDPKGIPSPLQLMASAIAIFGALWWLMQVFEEANQIDWPPPGCCPRCDYDLTGNLSGRCPECGKKIRR
jgi:hypothetical protein